MANISVSDTIHAPLAQVWDSWDAFGEIQKFNPGLKKSALINNSPPSGKGAQRQCDMKGGRNYVRERIVEYVPQERMAIDIYDGTMPMKNTRVVIRFKALGDRETQVIFDMEFTPKMGLIGLMMVPMMKGMMRKTIRSILKGNAAYVEQGVILNAA